MERRLAAILAADVQGYTRHTERNEEASTATLRMYRAVLEESIAAHKGHVFSSPGDGVVAEFPSVVEAIRLKLVPPCGAAQASRWNGTKRRSTSCAFD